MKLLGIVPKSLLFSVATRSTLRQMRSRAKANRIGLANLINSYFSRGANLIGEK
jgi:hypothetical protein